MNLKDISNTLNSRNDDEIILDICNENYMVFFTCFDTITAYFGHKNSTLETVIENKKEYNNMRELIQYLRVMKFDSAIDYDIYPYIEEILTALYKTKLVTTEDILGKWA